MAEITLNVEGMHCEGCEKRIINGLSLIENVKEVKANHEEKIVNVKYQEPLNLELVKEKLVDLGFEVN